MRKVKFHSSALRYVPPARRNAYEKAVAGYARFMELAERYADAVIARTEREIAKIKVTDGRTLRFAKSRQKQPTPQPH